MIGQSQQIRVEFQYMSTTTPNTITKAPTMPAFHYDVRAIISNFLKSRSIPQTGKRSSGKTCEASHFVRMNQSTELTD